MARGKHKVRSANRRSSAANALIEQLNSELALEQEALGKAEDALEKLNVLRNDLATENAALLEDVAPLMDQLQQERAFLRSLLADARSHTSRISPAWSRVMDTAMDLSPGATGLEKIESFMRATGSNAVLDTDTLLKQKNTTSITRLQRARGERRDVAEGYTPEESDRALLEFLLDLGNLGPAMIRPAYRQRLLDQDVAHLDETGKHHVREDGLTREQEAVKAEMIRVARRVNKSTADDLTADAVHAWGPGRLISTDGEARAARRALGFTPGTGQQAETRASTLRVPAGVPLPSIPATTRNALSGRGAEEVLGDWQDVFASRRRIATRLGIRPDPFAPLAHHPYPGHGLAAQNSYALSAFADWIRDGPGSAHAPVAVGMTAAATYWLPAGQTAPFAESEPLSDTDRAEMVLPFPQVFLAFAEPLLLEPSTDAPSHAEKTWHALSAAAHDTYTKGSTADRICEVRTMVGGSPSIDEAISDRGAHIEGVLLLADSLGRPQDQFAWCLAIPGDYGSALGRFVVPALRSTTDYRTLVDNLTAVVSWAQWHEPDRNTTVPVGAMGHELEGILSSPDFQRNARRSGAGIRVVDVKSTHRGPSTSAGESESHVAPHIRRGHWRRQRFGAKRQQVKRIRIAPVLVNAHRGDIAPRVYRLRADAQSVPARG